MRRAALPQLLPFKGGWGNPGGRASSGDIWYRVSYCLDLKGISLGSRPRLDWEAEHPWGRQGQPSRL